MSIHPTQTQIQLARQGDITPAMKAVSEQEDLSVETICQHVAAGQTVIPANHHHTNLRPIGIGAALRTKINANIGNSALSSNAECELSKLHTAISYGADTVMDLSTGADIADIRRAIISASTVPIGTVPIYEAVSRVEQPEDITPELLLDVVEDHARQGVDYITVHVGVLKEHVARASQRLLGIVSRGGAITARWMKVHNKQNLLYTNFDALLDICRTHDVTLSLGDGLRPGCLADASDDAQFAELETLGELVRRSREAGVQAMVEGPGHIPLDQIEMNMRREAEVCDGAPFYILGPVVTDCAPGYDHITSAIGAAVGAMHGAAMLCYVTPKEHLGLPNARDVRDGVIAYKIAAHAADIGRHRPGARQRDDDISRARAAFDWEEQFRLALDPEKARELREEALHERRLEQEDSAEEANRYCTMCGPKFCSMRVSQQAIGTDEGE
ncbi:MAG: phosphomethylpyrimidine synthase ThiC [Candidatus Pacebacteria bacterium]|nr:phosphomethylpyrimidine synthase ThiC [Candidatus Paceibacterota bacterium]